MTGVQARHVNLGVQGRHPVQICWRNLNGEMIGVQVRRVNIEVQGAASCIRILG